MSPTETVYFWTWYKTGLGKTGRRSFTRAAAILNKSIKTLVDLAETSIPTWYELAEQKDSEIVQKLDDAVIDSIIEDANEVLKRQRLVIRELYKKIVAAIKKSQIEYKLADIIKLFEHESLAGGPARSEAGESLSGLLNFVSSEVRSELHRAVRESRVRTDNDILRP